MAYGVIYMIWNMRNGKKYVGQTRQPLKKRISSHKSNKKSLIGKAIRKYGAENFRYGVIKACESKAEMDYLEKFLIAALKTKSPTGYNRTDGGDGSAGCIEMVKRSNTPYKNLLSIIVDKKLSYSDLDNLLGLGQSSFSHKMRGKVNFTEQEIVKLAEIFGKPAEYLLQRDDGIEATTFEAKRHARLSVARHNNSPFKNLICEMDKHQFSSASLAKILELDASQVSRKIRDEVIFTIKDKTKLVEIFGKPIEYLFARDDIPPIKSKAERNAKISATRRNNITFKNLVCEIDKYNLSYNALANLMGVSSSSVSLKVRGKVRFTAKDIAKLVEIFSKPAEYLMERCDGLLAITSLAEN